MNSVTPETQAADTANTESTAASTSALTVAVSSRIFDAADGTQLSAVKDLTFQIAPNTFTCIVGPSGCGKTTTLRMILGLDKGFEGDITRAKSGPMAAVFQEPRLLPWRSVEQNVRLALPKEQRAMNLQALFDELGLTHVKDFFPNELSLGLARRASLARAFALSPELLILDEPFVSLDDDTAIRLRELLMSLWEKHSMTALMVTHNVAEAAQLADQILIFSERPARVVGQINLDTPRSERDAAFVQRTVEQVKSVSD